MSDGAPLAALVIVLAALVAITLAIILLTTLFSWATIFTASLSVIACIVIFTKLRRSRTT
jgi:hypothetical protein